MSIQDSTDIVAQINRAIEIGLGNSFNTASEADETAEQVVADSNRRKELAFIRKSGPAFDTPLAVDLARSLQLQAVAAAGQVLLALTRSCFEDAMPAWTRLLAALNLTVAPVTIELVRGAHHNARLLEAIVLALSSAEGPEAPMRWANADALMRAYARFRADQCHAEAREIADAAKSENVDESEVTAAQAVCFRQADVFTAFAEGN